MIGDRDFKNFQAFRDRVLDFLADELNALTSILSILESEEVFFIEEPALLDRLSDPLALIDVPFEVLRLGDDFTQRGELVREALVEVRDEAAMVLNEDLQVEPVLARR